MNWIAITSGVGGIVLLGAAALTVLGMLAFARTRRPRFIAVAAAFLVLLLRAGWTLWAMHEGHSWQSIAGAGTIADAGMLALLYFAAMR